MDGLRRIRYKYRLYTQYESEDEMIPFFCNVSIFDLDPRILSEIRQSTVTTSLDPNTEVTEEALGQILLLTILYPVNRLDLFEIKRD